MPQMYVTIDLIALVTIYLTRTVPRKNGKSSDGLRKRKPPFDNLSSFKGVSKVTVAICVLLVLVATSSLWCFSYK